MNENTSTGYKLPTDDKSRAERLMLTAKSFRRLVAGAAENPVAYELLGRIVEQELPLLLQLLEPGPIVDHLNGPTVAVHQSDESKILSDYLVSCVKSWTETDNKFGSLLAIGTMVGNHIDLVVRALRHV